MDRRQRVVAVDAEAQTDKVFVGIGGNRERSLTPAAGACRGVHVDDADRLKVHAVAADKQGYLVFAVVLVVVVELDNRSGGILERNLSAGQYAPRLLDSGLIGNHAVVEVVGLT